MPSSGCSVSLKLKGVQCYTQCNFCNNLLVIIIQETEIQYQPKVPTVCNPSRFWQMLKPQILCALEDPRILSM